MTIILKTCSNAFEAEVLKGRLASEGIPSIIQGENINAIYGGIAGLSVNVLINEEDEERAKALLEEAGSEA